MPRISTTLAHVELIHLSFSFIVGSFQPAIILRLHFLTSCTWIKTAAGSRANSYWQMTHELTEIVTLSTDDAQLIKDGGRKYKSSFGTDVHVILPLSTVGMK